MHLDPYHLANTNLECLTLWMGWLVPQHTTTITTNHHLCMGHFNIPNHMEDHIITLIPLTNKHILLFSNHPWVDPRWHPWCVQTLNQVQVPLLPQHITWELAKVLHLLMLPMNRCHKKNRNFHFLVHHSPWLLHMENCMSTLTLFNPLPFNNFILLNSWIRKIKPISGIIPRRKEKNDTISTRDQEETTPNKTNLLGETRIEVTKTPNGTIKKNVKGRKTTKTLGQTSLALFAVSMDIILTTAPKFLTSNRWNNPWTHNVLQHCMPLSRPHNITWNNYPWKYCKTLFHTKVWWIPNRRYTLLHHKWSSIKTHGPSTLEIWLITTYSSLVKKILFFKAAVVNTMLPLNILQPPQKQLQL